MQVSSLNVNLKIEHFANKTQKIKIFRCLHAIEVEQILKLSEKPTMSKVIKNS